MRAWLPLHLLLCGCRCISEKLLSTKDQQALVTTLKHQATQRLSEQEPVLITEHGKPSASIVDVDDFEFMQKRIQILEAIAKGGRARNRGDTLSNIEAK